MVVARKPGKLPEELIQEKYNLEYGNDSLSIQSEALEKFNSYAIVDDPLATGGTVDCVAKLIHKKGKRITGLLTVIEIIKLNERLKFNFSVEIITM